MNHSIDELRRQLEDLARVSRESGLVIEPSVQPLEIPVEVKPVVEPVSLDTERAINLLRGLVREEIRKERGSEGCEQGISVSTVREFGQKVSEFLQTEAGELAISEFLSYLRG